MYVYPTAEVFADRYVSDHFCFLFYFTLATIKLITVILPLYNKRNTYSKLNESCKEFYDLKTIYGVKVDHNEDMVYRVKSVEMFTESNNSDCECIPALQYSQCVEITRVPFRVAIYICVLRTA